MGATLGLVSAGVGAVGSLSSLFGGGGNTAPTASAVQPAANPWDAPYVNGKGGVSAAGNFVSGIPGLSQYNQWPQLLPQAQGAVAGMGVNNPGLPQWMQGAQQGAQYGAGAAANAYGVGGGLIGAGQSLLPWGNQLLQTGFDPQNALYARTADQVAQQARAGLSARGLNSSPYGAGVESGAMGNFNIDWQNAQLQRQIAAAGGAGNLFQTGAGLQNMGVGLQGQAPGMAFSSSAMPYQVGQGAAQDTLGGLNTLGTMGAQGQTQQQQQLQQWLDYMKAATGVSTAATSATNSNLAGNQLNFNQNQQLYNNQQQAGSQLGGSLAALGKNWPSGWGAPSSWFGGPQASGTSVA